MVGNTPFSLCVGKWDPRMMSDKWLQQNKGASGKAGYGINVVKMRYSQVLLYYAEAMNYLAGPDGHVEGDAGITAREALAEVHTRAFSNENKAEALNYVNGLTADNFSMHLSTRTSGSWQVNVFVSSTSSVGTFFLLRSESSRRSTSRN